MAHHPAVTLIGVPTDIGAGHRGARLGRSELPGGDRVRSGGSGVGAGLQLRQRELGASALEFGAFALRLRLPREALLGEGGAGVELEAHLLGRLARLGEDAEGLVEPHGVPLGGVELVAPLPGGQQVHEPQHDCDEDDDTTAENLASHALHGRAAEARDPASVPRV